MKAGEGGHIAIIGAVQAQLGKGRGGLDEMNWMRRRRNDVEYPTQDRRFADSSEAQESVDAARDVIDKVRQLLDVMPVFR
ncbi:hypothetical protein [Occultella kanbiaonis]|uniref:hypothetical protein n=1 Tax=Occultella kanbiaonis TaxID=2675754 RepID=UPI0013D166E9|nr:hypothetical protein [Occultella kanbiaonis]